MNRYEVISAEHGNILGYVHAYTIDEAYEIAEAQYASIADVISVVRIGVSVDKRGV